ncbi:MAG: glucoamylase family protein, partial [Gemmatimonadota bacterium]
THSGCPRRYFPAMRFITSGASGAAALVALLACNPIDPPPATTPAIDSRAVALLDTIQQRTFAYFWERTDPATGLTPDRWPTQSFSSIAAVGFALTAYPVGVERGYVSRADAATRTLTTLRWFWQAKQDSAGTDVSGYHGLFYHFLNPQDGTRFKTVELSTIDTALLLAGVLFSQQYFDQSNPDEAAIRAYADSLYRRVDWQWAVRPSHRMGGGWSPEEGFPQWEWSGYDEGMILYLLALGSPTHPAPPESWTAWTASYQWGTFYGQTHLGFPPLFGHQYTQLWVDFRGIQDPYMRGHGIDYFENSRRATNSQRAYATANPMGWVGYDSVVWGLTATDGPADVTLPVDGTPRRFYTYAARGTSFIEPPRDDGTLAPTAVGGSVPFAPEISINGLYAMRQRYGDDLFGRYGFVDAFNPTWTWSTPAPSQGKVVPGKGWFDTDYLGIDQGPILLMIENYRSGLIWKYMRKSPYIVQGLRRAGFTGGWLDQAR